MGMVSEVLEEMHNDEIRKLTDHFLTEIAELQKENQELKEDNENLLKILKGYGYGAN